MSQSRETALAQIQSLITQFNLTQQDILTLYRGQETQSGGMLQRVMLYIGGVLVFAGLCFYIAMQWDEFNSYARVLVSLGSGLVAFILGLMTLDDERFHRAATPLFVISAALVPTGLMVTLNEFFEPTGDMLLPTCVVLGATLVQFAVGFALTNRTSLAFFSLFFFYSFLMVFMAWLKIDPPYGPLTLSTTAFLVCRGVDRTSHAVITPFFYFWAGAITAAAAYDLLHDGPLDVLLIGVAAGMIYLSTLVASRVLLTVSVLSLLAYLGYYTDEYFKDIVGWPIALIVMGMIMMGISVFAVKLGRKIAKTGA